MLGWQLAGLGKKKKEKGERSASEKERIGEEGKRMGGKHARAIGVFRCFRTASGNYSVRICKRQSDSPSMLLYLPLDYINRDYTYFFEKNKYYEGQPHLSINLRLPIISLPPSHTHSLDLSLSHTMLSKHPLHLFMFLLFLPFWSSAKPTINSGFNVEVIHRDSPLSPFYNASANPFQRFMEAARRSLARSRSYRSSFASPSSIRSTVSPDISDHLMKFSIGTPPVQVLVVMDTGSDLVWSRCKPCVDCIGRNVPLFDPQQSSTYVELSCNSPRCMALDATACDKGPKCNYTYGYGDGSSTSGLLATETLTFDTTDGGTFSVKDVAFGCGYNNSVSFSDHLYGLAGLGRQSNSLISQLGPYIGRKFSYCFVPFQENTSTSIMSFGDQAVLTGRDVVSTPLLGQDSVNFYFVILERISVGGTTLDVPPPKASGIGNMFIDSGTTVTLIDSTVYPRLKKALNEVVKLPPTTDPGKKFLCYNATARDGFPTITFHFSGDADLVLQPLNAFTEPSSDGLVCLVMLPTDGTPIFGNTVQQNFHLSYDLVGKTLSFKPTQCSRLSK